MLVAYGIKPAIRDHVVAALTGRDMVLAVLSRRGISLLGADGDLRELMRTALRLQPEFTADELADRMPRRARGVDSKVDALVSAGALGDSRGRQAEASSDGHLRIACSN